MLCLLKTILKKNATACYQQADIRMRLRGLRQLVDDRSVASCLSKLGIHRLAVNCFNKLMQFNEIDKFVETGGQVVTNRGE